MATVVDPLILNNCILTALTVAILDVPIVTGNLRNSVKVDIVNYTEFKIYFRVTRAPYAEWVNNFSPRSAGWLQRFQVTLKNEIEKELRKVGYII